MWKMYTQSERAKEMAYKGALKYFRHIHWNKYLYILFQESGKVGAFVVNERVMRGTMYLYVEYIFE